MIFLPRFSEQQKQQIFTRASQDYERKRKDAMDNYYQSLVEIEMEYRQALIAAGRMRSGAAVAPPTGNSK